MLKIVSIYRRQNLNSLNENLRKKSLHLMNKTLIFVLTNKSPIKNKTADFRNKKQLFSLVVRHFL